MSELTYLVLRLGLLVLLWVFVLAVVGTLRTDLFGARAGARRSSPGRTPPAPAPPAPGRERPQDRLATSLVVVEGDGRGTAVALTGSPVTVGRAPECTLCLGDDYASGRHAQLYREDARWWLEDLGSTNGTEVDGAPVTGPVALEVGSRVRVGRTVLELRR